MCNLFPLLYADADIYDNKIIENSVQSGKDFSTLTDWYHVAKHPQKRSLEWEVYTIETELWGDY